MMNIGNRLAPTLCVIALIVACGRSDGADDSAPMPTSDRVDSVRDWSSDIAWAACGVGLECGSFEVPFDYSDPSGDTFVLPVTRRLANSDEKRIGSLLINPGGPGAPLSCTPSTPNPS